MKRETLDESASTRKLRVKQRSNMAAQVRLVRARAGGCADVPGPGLRRVDERLQPRLHHVPDRAAHRHAAEGLHGVGPLHVDHRRDRAVRRCSRAPLVGRAAPPQADHRDDPATRRTAGSGSRRRRTRPGSTRTSRGKLIESGLDRIYLSMDGLTKETYEKVRVKRQLRGGAREHRALPRPEARAGLAGRGRHPDRPPVGDRRRGRGLREALEVKLRRPDQHQGARHVGRSDRRGARVAVDEDAVEHDPATSDRKPCPNLWYHCHIHWDGVLVSCSRDYDAVTPLGNVRNGGVLKTGTARGCG